MAGSFNSDVTSPGHIVLETKLRTPLLRPEYLPRPRLLELLGAGFESKITLVDAPPGYGKTTLLSQWLRSRVGTLPSAWVSLDDQDNDPVRLWVHITEALRRVVPEEAFETNGSEGLGLNGTRLIQTALPMFINGLTNSQKKVALILDGYHCITESECHELVTFLVGHLPETVHLIFSTRHDLPLPLGRLRVMGEVNEIRAEQLAFSEEEAASLLQESMHLDIDPAHVRTLLDRTEGWPAAIYLAALSLRDKKDVHAFIESFRGSNRYIVEILGEEVLATLPEEEREFLLRSSILKGMSASLCEAVTEAKNSGKLLRELEHSNLFIIPLDDNGEWYRHHKLFADFLRYELSNTQPPLVPVLHERASKWFERAGYVEAAIHHALEAEQFTRAGLLIARHWLEYVARGQTATLERWLAALPEDLIKSDVPLDIVRAWLAALRGRPEESESFLALAEGGSYEGKLPDGSASAEAGVSLVRGLFGYGGVQAMLEAARRTEELEPPGQTSLRIALLRLAQAMGLYYSGESSRARKPVEEALRLTNSDQHIVRITALCVLSLVATDEGRFEESELIAREARVVVEKFGLEGVPQCSAVPIALGRALAERGRLAEAQIELERGISIRDQFPSLCPWMTLVGLRALIEVRAANGDRTGAQALLAEAHAIIENYPDAGMFPNLLKHRERELRKSKRQEEAPTQELTARELAVLRLLDGERTNREIGRLLYVSPNTVKAHVKSINRKLEVSSRQDAAEQAHARGLI